MSTESNQPTKFPAPAIGEAPRESEAELRTRIVPSVAGAGSGHRTKLVIGSRVKLSDFAIRKNIHKGATDRRGTVLRFRRDNGNPIVLWDGRSSPDTYDFDFIQRIHEGKQ